MKSHELWWCGNNLLYGFKRTKPLDNVDNIIYKFANGTSDFSTFVLMKDFIVTGDRYILIYKYHLIYNYVCSFYNKILYGNILQ